IIAHPTTISALPALTILAAASGGTISTISSKSHLSAPINYLRSFYKAELFSLIRLGPLCDTCRDEANAEIHPPDFRCLPLSNSPIQIA
ncbi:MAG: hypothetical protein WBE78_00880, partial [Candidatus Binataceae bacterium]